MIYTLYTTKWLISSLLVTWKILFQIQRCGSHPGVKGWCHTELLCEGGSGQFLSVIQWLGTHGNGPDGWTIYEGRRGRGPEKQQPKHNRCRPVGRNWSIWSISECYVTAHAIGQFWSCDSHVTVMCSLARERSGTCLQCVWQRLTRSIETQMVFQSNPFISWYNPSQAYTVKHVSYPRLTATMLLGIIKIN